MDSIIKASGHITSILVIMRSDDLSISDIQIRINKYDLQKEVLNECKAFNWCLSVSLFNKLILVNPKISP